MESLNVEPSAEAGEGEPGAAEEQEPGRPPVHYSTGRLTRAQADAVNAWRARLREDRPLPGQPRAGDLARLFLGADNRPPASCSDAIAAAVDELLARQPPDPLELARYAYAGMAAQEGASQGQGEDAAPLYPPVSYYLPAELADRAEELRSLAFREVLTAGDELAEEGRRRHPGDTRADAIARGLWLSGALASRGLPYERRIPRGAIARLAIDRWARRDADQVAAAAVDYAAAYHDQPHRARRDMRKLRR